MPEEGNIHSYFFGNDLMAIENIGKIIAQVEVLVRVTLDIGEDVQLEPNSDLISEVGLDSIEAYEAIAALHTLLGARIPKDLDPLVVRSIGGMSEYVASRFSPEQVGEFLALDVNARIAALRTADTLE